MPSKRQVHEAIARGQHSTVGLSVLQLHHPFGRTHRETRGRWTGGENPPLFPWTKDLVPPWRSETMDKEWCLPFTRQKGGFLYVSGAKK